MIVMIFKMTAIVACHILLTVVLWRRYGEKKLSMAQKCLIGVIFGLCAVWSNHNSVNYGHSLLNIRDLSPLTAGLFFDPVSGIIAGLIGGIERYIVGTYFNIGSYSRVACSISTCLAGFLAAFLNVYIFKGKKPSGMYAFFMGAVMEVFHMYMVYLSHRHDIVSALEVVSADSGPMIFFTGSGLFLTSIAIMVYSGKWVNPFKRVPGEKISLARKFRIWMFAFTFAVLVANFAFSYIMQTQKSKEDTEMIFEHAESDLATSYYRQKYVGGGKVINLEYHIGLSGGYYMVRKGECIAGTGLSHGAPANIVDIVNQHEPGVYFNEYISGVESLCRIKALDNYTMLIVTLPLTEVYNERETLKYATLFGNIITLALLFILISTLVQAMVVDKLEKVNGSLNKITNGDLQEEVSVYDSMEFSVLSDDINQMVTALKGYIDAAEKRVEEELSFAKSVQESALPHNFTFDRSDFEIYAIMEPAKHVGGDFYDFFFVGADKLVLVIADVSGKGIPAALFMMRSKTAIRTVAEKGLSPGNIIQKVNKELCEGNDEGMFVTVWIGIIDLKTGVMKCANAGHEYPMIGRNGQYDIFSDKHTMILGVMDTYDFSEYDITLQPGDSIFVYTDGVPEAINVEEEQYGLERLKVVLNDHSGEPLQELLPAVFKDTGEYSVGMDQFDDITMLGFKYLG